MGRTTKRETENKRAIGLDNPSPGSVSLGEMGGLGRNAMDALVGKAAEYAKPKKRDGSKRKRGGQPGNTNGVKSGIYTRVDKFEKRFQSYSKALGRASAQEEVALTRAMMMNLLSGKTPLGDSSMKDAEYLESMLRDVMMMNLKAQELALKQEARRAENGIRFQSTCPLRGTTIGSPQEYAPYVISIHVPLAGHDVITVGNRRGRRTNFNPRAPCGARRGNYAPVAVCVTFQSTCPLRGTTSG